MDESTLLVPKVKEMRYSLDLDGWLWRVEVGNPWPRHDWDANPVAISGFAKRRKHADRAAHKAIKTLDKRLARAFRETHKEFS